MANFPAAGITFPEFKEKFLQNFGNEMDKTDPWVLWSSVIPEARMNYNKFLDVVKPMDERPMEEWESPNLNEVNKEWGT